jgi:hypothetical protein
MLICNAEASVFMDNRQYFVNEDDTVPQKVCKVSLNVLHRDGLLIVNFYK